ncbi:MAG: hypothetical protein AAFO81_07140 [Pseudomonadota bacterium]
MIRAILSLVLCVPFASALAQTSTFALSDADFTVSPIFSDIREFDITIEIDEPLRAGIFDDPFLVEVDYSVTGTLTQGTPSGFNAFALQRTLIAQEFYTQGGTMSFQVDLAANLDDGVQASELVPDANGIILTFNAREVDTGRFHPALLVLSADGTGSIRNSNNIIALNPLQEIMEGDEYITDLTFIPAEFTLFDVSPEPTPEPPPGETPIGGFGPGSGSGAFGLPEALFLFVVSLVARRRRRFARS